MPNLSENLQILEKWKKEREALLQEIAISEGEVSNLNEKIQTTIIATNDLEEKIYKLSLENFVRQATKESLICCVDEVHKLLMGEKNNIWDVLDDMQDEDVRNTMIELLKINWLLK